MLIRSDGCIKCVKAGQTAVLVVKMSALVYFMCGLGRELAGHTASNICEDMAGFVGGDLSKASTSLSQSDLRAQRPARPDAGDTWGQTAHSIADHAAIAASTTGQRPPAASLIHFN